MKKLNITKEQFEKSRYFNKKYGKLEYVSESGKLFNDTTVYGLDSGYVKETGWRARIYKDNGMYEYTIEQWDGKRKEWMKTAFGTPSRSIEQMLEDLATETDGTDIPICCELPLARKVAGAMKNSQLNESGKLYKTNKGKVLMFKESDDEKFIHKLLRALYQAEFGRDYIIDLESKDTISILDREGNGYMLNISTVGKSFAVNEAIPKTLKEIPQEQAERLIQKHLRAGTGEWEGSPGYSDFIYEIGGGRYKLIRPGFDGRYETGIVSM